MSIIAPLAQLSTWMKWCVTISTHITAMINFTLTPSQRAAVRRQRSHPFRFLMDQPEEFDRVYAWSSWADATQLRQIHPRARSVIDIGCGQAGVAAIQNMVWGMEIYLIDGAREGQRDAGYESADSMNHYSTWSDLPQTLKLWGCDMSRVHFIDIDAARRYPWSRVDLVQSLHSCGAHYPIDTYDWLYDQVNHGSTLYSFVITDAAAAKIPLEFELMHTVPMINYPYLKHRVLRRGSAAQ
jgi:SAM-dependent methyltransferase